MTMHFQQTDKNCTLSDGNGDNARAVKVKH